MRITLIFALTTCLFSCSKKHENSQKVDLPYCIETHIEENSEDLHSVKRQFINGEYHYWLNTGDMAFDGVEEVVNGECEEVCLLCGFCFPDDCVDQYDMNEWLVIWGE